MNKHEEAKLSMYESVLAFLTEPAHVAIYAASSGVNGAVAKLQAKVDKLHEYHQGQMQTSKGATVTKDSKRMELLDEIMLAANALKSYGYDVQNYEIAGQATLNKSVVAKLPDTELSTKGKIIYALANNNMAAVANYNYPAAKLPVLAAAISSFEANMQTPKHIIGSKKTNTAYLKAGFTDTDKYLQEVLDPAILTYSETQGQFVSDYFNVRVIFDVGGQKLSAKFTVSESVNNGALAHVRITIMPGDVRKKTSALGKSLVKGLAEGSYTATLSKPGYVTQVKSFNVVSTETAVVTVSMVAG